jgi:hypothetical protein
VPALLATVWKALHARYSDVKRLNKILKIKKLMLEMLFTWPHTTFSQAAVQQQLEAFVQSQAPGGWTSKFAGLPPCTKTTGAGALVIEWFSDQERATIARALIRKRDRSFAYHCPDPQCGQECAFALQRCPHPGCNVRFSQKWWGEHDALCPHKVITCPLQCGRLCVRSMAQRHTRDECIMRPATCPYQNVKCFPVGTSKHRCAPHRHLSRWIHVYSLFCVQA